MSLQKLLFYDWPGNIRELEHVIERAVVLCEQPVIRDGDIAIPSAELLIDQQSFKEAKEKFLREFERSYLEKLLLLHRGNISQAARTAQKHRRAFWELIRKHGIDIERFK